MNQKNTINSKLSVTDSFQFPVFSSENLTKNIGQDDFKYLNQELDNNMLDLIKQK